MFPGGRTQKVHTIELMATLYDPAQSAQDHQSDPSGDETEAATVAIPSSVPPPAILPSLESVSAPPARRRWRPHLLTFALGVLGALLGGHYFPSIKVTFRPTETAQATELSTRGSTRDPSPAAQPPKTASPSPAFTGMLRQQPPDGERPGDAMNGDGKLAAADSPPGSSDGEAAGGTSSKTTREKEHRKRGGRRFGSKAPSAAGTAASSTTLVAPVRNLELGSEFAAYAPVRLPPSLLTQRNSSSPAAH